ncbi:putative alkaline ceramidase dcd3A [Smittium culicis]|uniref:Putative alkaline ceramidase dcd3A n=1 Tax=Smittium culicis TaxID=133412 RepID=A0A1R1X6U8_9FUNG|nr:putative alkaline ceramidase dcd3A [Smittium culicis]
MAPTIGFWGPVTASVDWCEDNYVKSYYIAEFYNTISSLVIFLVGEYGVRKAKSDRLAINLMFRAISLVGIGSVLFHCTLKQPMQMFDEIPMLWSAITILYTLSNSRYKLDQLWFKAALIGVGLLSTFLTAFFRGSTQFLLFHISFGSLEISGFILLYLAKADLHSKFASKCDNISKNLFSNGLKWYGLAVICWLIDTFFCEYINAGPQSIIPIYFQLHAFWHIFVSFGLVNFVVLVVVYCKVNSGESVRLKLGLLGLPEISNSKRYE